MNRRVGLLLGLVTIVTLLTVGAPRPVRADGGVFISPHMRDVEMPAQKAIIVYDAERGHEDLILSVELLGSLQTVQEGIGGVSATPTSEEEAASAAWVVPVPSLPEVKAASPEWFVQLSNLTKPETETDVVYVTDVVVEKGVEKEKGVELISREQVGVYDVSILSADEPGALLEWLNEHGYAFPEKGGPLLDAYVREGDWYFVAARVLPGESAYLDGDVQPLWFSFDAERPVYPMRLTSLVESPISGVLIYVLADHRMEIRRHDFKTEFAGELRLKPNPLELESDLVDLLTRRPYYVTKLRHGVLFPSTLKKDLYLRRAASDEPYRKAEIRAIYRYRPETERPPNERLVDNFWDWLLEGKGRLGFWVGLALLGLLVGLGLVRRRSRRKPDEEQEPGKMSGSGDSL